MELRDLISKAHNLHEQLKNLQAQEADLKAQIQTLEKNIKRERCNEQSRNHRSITITFSCRHSLSYQQILENRC